ncbi:VTT domain-containing protein [Actinomyces israelii]|uniref:VTT domain-containing protein n=2 Tax=Actinomyces israelii TaxID=1659 RepID=UPI000AF73C8E|nr:VTT domain-containing protein [Actinomyces israelii]
MPLATAATAGLSAALPQALPGAPAPALGPEWLDAASIITKIVEWFGPWAIVGVMLVIFAETGLLVGFFLPGDSLLFTLGMFVGTGAVGVHIWVAAPLVWLAAIIGNQTGYAIGRKAGPAIFNRPDSRLFKKEYVDRTAAFFERHGGKAVTLAQFVPIVRTFTPVMAGVGKMHYRHFFIFNAIGATFWAFAITWLGYFLGSIEWIQKNIDAMILGIVFVSVLPMLISALRSWLSSRRAGPQPAQEPSPETREKAGVAARPEV